MGFVSGNTRRYLVQTIEFSSQCDQTRLEKKKAGGGGEKKKRVILKMAVTPSRSELLPEMSETEYLF